MAKHPCEEGAAKNHWRKWKGGAPPSCREPTDDGDQSTGAEGAPEKRHPFRGGIRPCCQYSQELHIAIAQSSLGAEPQEEKSGDSDDTKPQMKSTKKNQLRNFKPYEISIPNFSESQISPRRSG
jgi:hypothetical protein